MNIEEKTIKLAEVAGFTDIMLPMGFHQQMSDEKSKECGGRWRFEIPKYFEDLNAVHELWLSLPRVSRILVVANLADMLGLPKGEEDEIGELEEALFSATASQRCEALGKTLNLW